MLNVYSSKELSDNQFTKMYEILINNLFKTYPEFLDDKDKYDNKDNYNNLNFYKYSCFLLSYIIYD